MMLVLIFTWNWDFSLNLFSCISKNLIFIFLTWFWLKLSHDILLVVKWPHLPLNDLYNIRSSQNRTLQVILCIYQLIIGPAAMPSGTGPPFFLYLGVIYTTKNWNMMSINCAEFQFLALQFAVTSLNFHFRKGFLHIIFDSMGPFNHSFIPRTFYKSTFLQKGLNLPILQKDIIS